MYAAEPGPSFRAAAQSDLRELTLDPRVSVLNVAAGRGSMYVVAEVDGSTSVFQVDPRRDYVANLQRAEL